MTSMLRAWSLSALFAVAPLALAPVAAQAQAPYGFHFNIAAGLTEPTGTFGDFYDSGYNAIVGIGTTPAGSPLGFRVEGIYNELGVKNGTDKAHAGGVTGNAVFNVLSPSSKQSNTLYLIGGVGYYSTREPDFLFDSQSNVGYNIGAGFKFPLSGFSAYIEARYHTVSNTDVRFVPISFGLMF